MELKAKFMPFWGKYLQMIEDLSEEDAGHMIKAMARYYMLAVPQMTAQVLLTQGVYSLFGIPDTATGLRTLVYVIVMSVLYVASFMIQQRWVFAAEQKTKEKV